MHRGILYRWLLRGYVLQQPVVEDNHNDWEPVLHGCRKFAQHHLQTAVTADSNDISLAVHWERPARVTVLCWLRKAEDQEQFQPSRRFTNAC